MIENSLSFITFEKITQLLTMKRITLTGLLLTLVVSANAEIAYHVSPTAKANGKGTIESPFNSIEVAKSRVAKTNKGMQEDIVVYLHGGDYTILTPLHFTEKDSGRNGHSIIYKAYRDEKPVITGGVKVSGWERVGGNIYSAKLDRDSKLRTLFVDGKRMKMAGMEEPIKAISGWGEFLITGDEPWAFEGGKSIDGIKFSSKDVSLYRNAEDVEIVQTNVFNHKILCVREVAKFADETILKLQQPYGAIAANLAWAGKIRYDKPFVIRNAYELLDQEGEFYFDKANKRVYVYSKSGDLNSSEVVAPLADGLITIVGSSNESRVENLRFEGITFSHDHWQLMEIDGSHACAGIQSCGLTYKYIPNGNWHPTEYNSCNVPRGAVEVRNAENIIFELNRFEGISSAIGINMVNDVVNSRITGNYFHDMLGNAVNVGHPQHYKIGDGPHFAPGVEGVCDNIHVTNNYIRNVSLDFRQIEGTSAFFVSNTHFDHNDVANTAYCAMAMGWWWGNSEIPPSTVAKSNSMSYNKAGNTHLSLDDGGILYLLGEQPGTMVEGNYVFNGPRCIYPDDGSAHLTIRRNVAINSTKDGNFWLHIWRFACHDIVTDDNYVKDNNIKNNGTNCPVTNTHQIVGKQSQEVKDIIAGAGIEPKYRHIIPAKESEFISLYPNSMVDKMNHN